MASELYGFKVGGFGGYSVLACIVRVCAFLFLKQPVANCSKMNIKVRVNEAEISQKLFQAVSVFCFSFISECATGVKRAIYIEKS